MLFSTRIPVVEFHHFFAAKLQRLCFFNEGILAESRFKSQTEKVQNCRCSEKV